jgi:hypothetical protein
VKKGYRYLYYVAVSTPPIFGVVCFSPIGFVKFLKQLEEKTRINPDGLTTFKISKDTAFPLVVEISETSIGGVFAYSSEQPTFSAFKKWIAGVSGITRITKENFWQALSEYYAKPECHSIEGLKF